VQESHLVADSLEYRRPHFTVGATSVDSVKRTNHEDALKIACAVCLPAHASANVMLKR
jgi:hypothetical protein